MTEIGPGALTASMHDVLRWLFDSATLDPAPTNSTIFADQEVERATRMLFLDTLGCAVGGGAKPELRAVNTALAALEPGPIALPGMSEALTAPAAASWCAMAATWDEACEGLARAHGRPGLHAFPVALSLALARGATLGEALVALLRGFEVGGRLGERLRVKAGMHVDGTWGTFGAVAAAGSILDHSSSTVMAAVESAACQSPMSLYLPVAQGAMVRNTYVAEAVRRAIAVALHAGAGVTAPTGALEAADGLAFAATETAAAIAPPGEWLVTQGYLKPFAAVRHVHYGAEAARRWRQLDLPTDSIEAISLDVYPEAVTYCGNRAPTTAIGAQFSLSYGIARMLCTGDLGPDAYSAEALNDGEVRRLEQLIDVRTQPGRSADERYGTLRVTTATGGHHRIHVDRVAGDGANPMTTEQVVHKFVDYCRWLTAWPADAVAGAILDGPLDTPLAEILLRGR